MIESVRLRNWKTHEDSLFEFGKGTNVLIGSMGSGKSSVMDAMCFALFGTFPSLQGRRVSLEENIMSKPREKEEATIELAFSYNGKKYRVERTIKKKGSTEAKAFCDGKIVAGPKPRDVNQAVETAIEINYNLFSRAVYSEQNEIDSFLKLAPGERKAKFDELLDLAKYEKVRSNAVTALNRLKGIAEDREKWVLEQEKDLGKGEEKELAEKIKGIEEKNRKLEAEAKEKNALEENLGKEVKELAEKEKALRKAREELAEKKASLEETKKFLEETKKEAGGKTLEKVKLGLEKAGKALKETENLLQEKEKAIELAGKEREGFSKKAALEEHAVKESQKHLEELKGLKGECPTCRQKLEETTREKLAEETRKQAEKAAKEMEAALKKEAEAGAKEKRLRGEKEKASVQRDQEKEKESSLKRLVVSLEKAEEKEAKAKTLESQVKELMELLEKTPLDEKALDAKRKQWFEAKSGSESAKKAIAANNELMKEVKSSMERIEKAKKQLQETREKVRALKESAEKMGYFVNSLLAAQKELREILVETINQAMQEIWQDIYPYEDLVSAKMEIVEKGYELKAREKNGKWVRVEGILSGGERSAAAICIRIAFSLVLTQNLSWLILDEPTHNLDEKAVQTLGGMMQKKLPSLVEQVFVITHDKEMKKAASATLYLLERDKSAEAATSPISLSIEE